MSLDSLAERYVKLVLAIGQHDVDYVDAYYGDPAWRPTGAPQPLPRLLERASILARDLADRAPAADARATAGTGDPGEEHDRWLGRQRHTFLSRQTGAAVTRLEMLLGTRLSFDEESRRLYDVVSPRFEEAAFEPVLAELDGILPGSGSLAGRYEGHRRQFLVPPDRLPAVFDAAIGECRQRTAAAIRLPSDETFRVEYVSNQPWSAYNWYRGGAASLIQVNTDLPMTLDRALDLAAHEGYPGHHVYNALLEAHLTRARGWVEFTVYPLFSPESVIAEGTANLAIEIAFPANERLAFEHDVLYPLAGLDPRRAEEHARVRTLLARLHYAGNTAARRYLDGEIDGETAAAWLVRWAMMPEDAARQRIRFFDRYRSYVISYNVGLDLARGWVGRRVIALAGAQASNTGHWRAFTELLTAPWMPSDLA